MKISKRQLAIVVALAALPVAGIAVIAMQPNKPRAAVGAPCTANVFCDSDECLSPATDKPASLDVPGGVCTAACTDDRGCPSSMRCGAVDFRVVIQVGEGSPPTGSRCIPRAW